METKPLLIVTFPSTHAALKGERALANADIKAVMIPVPRWITADCGIALRFDAEMRSRVEKALSEAGAEYKGIYEEAGSRRLEAGSE